MGDDQMRWVASRKMEIFGRSTTANWSSEEALSPTWDTVLQELGLWRASVERFWQGWAAGDAGAGFTAGCCADWPIAETLSFPIFSI